jgi:F0F1-type ATP synthase assembly protein I
MKQTSLPKTPSPAKSAAKPAAKADQSNPRGQFFAAALSMSWQLAIVVLVPIIGGFELDKALDILPVLTIAGFFIAMTGMALVVWHQLQVFSPPPPHKGAHS